MPLSSKIFVSTGGIHGRHAQSLSLHAVLLETNIYTRFISLLNTSRCWFAAEDIAKGEKLWWAPEQLHPLEILVSIDEMMAWPAEKRDKFMELAYQINDTTMAGFPDDLTELPAEYVAENFVNHSCDGCAWYEGSDLLVACRGTPAFS